MIKTHIIEKEEKLLNKLGLHLQKNPNTKTLLILDDNKNEVGTIKPEPKEDILNYKTTIEKNGLKYEMETLCDQDDIILPLEDNYIINITKDGQYFGKVVIQYPDEFADETIINSHNAKGESAALEISQDGFLIHIQGTTDNYKTIEEIHYKDIIYDKEFEFKSYSYSLTYCKKDGDIKDEFSNRNICRILEGETIAKQSQIKQQTWKGNKLVFEEAFNTDENVLELATENEMGLHCINYLQRRLNEEFPLCDDVITQIIDEKILKESNLPQIMKSQANNTNVHKRNRIKKELETK